MYTYYFSKLSKKDFMEKYDFSREAFDIAYNCGIEKLKDIVRIKQLESSVLHNDD